MLEIGDVIVHFRHGAGTVMGTRNIKRGGQERLYYWIEMAGNIGTLYIPKDQVDEDRLRYALHDTSLIQDVMSMMPNELNDHHQLRRNDLEKKIRSGNPQQILQVVRDLTWRQRIGKLTTSDRQMRDTALQQLVEEVALSSSQAVDGVRARIDQIIDTAMQRHLAHHNA
jgi:RNA polymerase-interacting CarD/CdnL/TRCF family regulator